MTRRPWNLAARPFRNETLPALLLVLGFVLLAAGSVAHALALYRLLPASTSARHMEVDELERRLEHLETRAAGFKRDIPPATLSEWLFVKDLVDRRAFSWTRLLRCLEEVLPEGVRVVALAPDQDDDVLELRLDAHVRSPEDGLELVRRLEARPEFDHVDPLSTGEAQEGGRLLRLRMAYVPRPEPEAPRGAGRRRAPAAETAEDAEEGQP